MFWGLMCTDLGKLLCLMLVIKNTLSLALMIQIGKKKYENADRKHL